MGLQDRLTKEETDKICRLYDGADDRMKRRYFLETMLALAKVTGEKNSLLAACNKLADGIDAVGDGDHDRLSCAETGCILKQVAIARAIALAEKGA